ncbi:hypothetical protein TNCV_2923401 [Trichonephila clavipes]|nr:hypothetical protein TNCV_2923401 [Trichonephila clavipes]
MPRVRSRKAHQHLSDIDKSRKVAWTHCAISYRCTAARVGQDPRRQACYPHDRNGSGSYVTTPESRIGVVCKATVCANCSTMFAEAWTLSSETIAADTLEAASQTGASSMTNLDAQMARHHFLGKPLFCLQHQDPS